MSGIKMIDISSNNHLNDEPIDWAEVKIAHYGAAMIKCTEGLDYENPWRNVDGHGAASRGLKVGYYHFARPSATGNDAQNQANFALASIAGLPRSIGLALDLEVMGDLGNAELDEWAKAFLATLAEKKIANTPIYLNQNWLADILSGAPWQYPLWLAAPGARIPRAYEHVWAWQAGQLPVPGIAGATDVGIFYG